ncbi:spore germination protein [Salipaludibacillus sp. LMS25]|uniref:GerAB/ArcD/ProY family transporter n=1 Tax=Salipaludibacillus sp. LMS25 TaxID=2924031 RepID=UPI0020CFEA8D|nr:GerAB/ArcD/ProY family transporter [Salipaludibacillus sp. LMS25]UTR13857.1 spore germination protein [Salipaludibacillus sp. LMS25]
MERISNSQIFVLVLAFLIGSTTLFALGIGAGRDAWLVILLEGVIGGGLLWVYTQFPKLYPHQPFSYILEQIIGKKIATLLLIVYCAYFYSQITYNFNEFSALIKMTTLPMTPRFVIYYLFLFTMLYLIILGFEVIARTCEVLLPYLVLFLITIFILTMFSGVFDFDAILPVLGDGFQPVLKELRVDIGFPNGELVVFMMFWHFAAKPHDIRKVAFTALIIATGLTMISVIIMISVLGVGLTEHSEIPFLEEILVINIADIIMNLDSIAVFIMFIGGFYKTLLHFMGFYVTFRWLFQGTKGKWGFLVFAAVFPIFNHYRFPGLDYQRFVGSGNASYIIPIFAFLPVLLFVISYLKRRRASMSHASSNPSVTH